MAASGWDRAQAARGGWGGNVFCSNRDPYTPNPQEEEPVAQPPRQHAKSLALDYDGTANLAFGVPVYPCGEVWLTGTHVCGSDKCGPSQTIGALNARREGTEAEEEMTLPLVS